MNDLCKTLRGLTRSCPVRVARVAPLLLATIAVLCGASAARAQVAINGDLTDMIAFANQLQAGQQGCGIVQNDPEGEVRLTDTTILPCPITPANTYYQNGFDQTLFVIAQQAGSTTVYLGVRVAGQIGDTDGNGNPDTKGGPGCQSGDNVTDVSGIGPQDSYQWSFDTNCDEAPDILVTVTGGGHSPIVQITDSVGNPVPGAS